MIGYHSASAASDMIVHRRTCPHPCAQKHSDWPTYPQLYAGGELLGGADIVDEMVRSSELGDALAAATHAASPAGAGPVSVEN